MFGPVLVPELHDRQARHAGQNPVDAVPPSKVVVAWGLDSEDSVNANASLLLTVTVVHKVHDGAQFSFAKDCWRRSASSASTLDGEYCVWTTESIKKLDVPVVISPQFRHQHKIRFVSYHKDLPKLDDCY